MSTMSHVIGRGKRSGSVSWRTLNASRSAFADARCPPPVSDIRIWIVAGGSTSAARRAEEEEEEEASVGRPDGGRRGHTRIIEGDNDGWRKADAVDARLMSQMAAGVFPTTRMAASV